MLAAVALIMIGIAGELRSKVNYDVAWLLHLGERVNAGDRLYVDLIEINPPLIVWLSAAAARIAASVGADTIIVFRVIVFGAILASLALSSGPAGQLGRERSHIFLAVAGVVLVPLSWKFFGEREHLVVVLALPYLLINSLPGPSVASDSARIAIGVLAGIGLALKPHFVPLALLLAADHWRREGTFRSAQQHVSLASTLLLYGVVAGPLIPDYLLLVESYGQLYWSLFRKHLLPLLFGRPAGVVAILALLVHLVMRGRLHHRGVADSLALSSAWFLIAATLQGKGLAYHYYPAFATGVLLLTWDLAAPRHADIPAGRHQLAPLLAASVIAAVLTFGAARAIQRLTPQWRPMSGDHGRLVALVDKLAPTGTFALLHFDLGQSFPAAMYTRASWGLGWPSLWFIEPLYGKQLRNSSPIQYNTVEQMGPSEAAAFQGVVSDVLSRQPNLLLFRRPSAPIRYPSDRFDILEYLSQSIPFRQFLRSCYQLTESDSLHAAYRLVPSCSRAIPLE